MRKVIYLLTIYLILSSNIAYPITIELWRAGTLVASYPAIPTIQNALNIAVPNDIILIDGIFFEKITWPNTQNLHNGVYLIKMKNNKVSSAKQIVIIH